MSERMGGCDWRITIADNGSTDDMPRIGRELAEKYPDVFYTRIEQRGRGRALKRVWSESDADIVGYMDMDLSTDLNALPALIARWSGTGTTSPSARASRRAPKS